MSCKGEKLTDGEVDLIFKLTGTEEDIEGNIKYEGIHQFHEFVFLLFVNLTKTAISIKYLYLCSNFVNQNLV